MNVHAAARLRTHSRDWLAAVLLAATPPAAAETRPDPALGRYLAGQCVTCHRLDGDFKGIPPILGWPAESFIAAMNAYKTGERGNPVMRTIAGKLSEEELAALAAHFGALSPRPSPK